MYSSWLQSGDYFEFGLVLVLVLFHLWLRVWCLDLNQRLERFYLFTCSVTHWKATPSTSVVSLNLPVALEALSRGLDVGRDHTRPVFQDQFSFAYISWGHQVSSSLTIPISHHLERVAGIVFHIWKAPIIYLSWWIHETSFIKNLI